MLRNNLRWTSIPFRGSPYVLHAEEPRWRGWNRQCYIWLDKNYVPINYQTTLGLHIDILWPKLDLYFNINQTFLLLDITTLFYSGHQKYQPYLRLVIFQKVFISCQNDLISFIMWGSLFQFKLSIPCLDLFFLSLLTAGIILVSLIPYLTITLLIVIILKIINNY